MWGVSDVPDISRDKSTLGYKISLINVVLGGHVRNIYTGVDECSTGKMHAFSYRGVQRGSNAGFLLELLRCRVEKLDLRRSVDGGDREPGPVPYAPSLESPGEESWPGRMTRELTQ